MRCTRVWFIAAVAVALLVGASPQVWAKQLDEAEIYIEINDTDGDAGIQMMLDGEDWKRMRAWDPFEVKILDVKARGAVGIQGMTELFFESAEPSFDEQPLAAFLALFPEGIYRFKGVTTDGTTLRGEAELTHDLPAAPDLVSPADGQDDVDPDNTVIEWMTVADPPGSSIVGYQVIVEREEPSLLVFSADVGPGVTSVTVPPEFMESGTEYKYEVLAIEESGNQTISEAEFDTE